MLAKSQLSSSLFIGSVNLIMHNTVRYRVREGERDSARGSGREIAGDALEGYTILTLIRSFCQLPSAPGPKITFCVLSMCRHA